MNGRLTTAGCPGHETLAAFLDDRVGRAEREEIERHLLDCADCRELVVMASEDASAAGLSKPETRWWLTLAAAAAMLVLAVWSLPKWLGRDAAVATAVATLAESRPDRPIAGRLSGDQDWRPLGSPTRGGSDAISANARLAMIEIDEAVERERTPGTLTASAVSRLFAGDTDGAVAALEEAAGMAAQSPSVWSDLSVAYLARADAPERASDLPRALEAVSRALALDASRPEYWFNKALILERQQVRPQAIDAWERCLSIDGSSAWAVEARARLAKLKQTGV
jgi:tetratricopeptide (TPR) repeat protein